MIRSFVVHLAHLHLNCSLLLDFLQIFAQLTRLLLGRLRSTRADFSISTLEGLNVAIVLFECLVHFSLDLSSHADVDVKSVNCSHSHKYHKQHNHNDQHLK